MRPLKLTLSAFGDRARIFVAVVNWKAQHGVTSGMLRHRKVKQNRRQLVRYRKKLPVQRKSAYLQR